MEGSTEFAFDQINLLPLVPAAGLVGYGETMNAPALPMVWWRVLEMCRTPFLSNPKAHMVTAMWVSTSSKLVRARAVSRLSIHGSHHGCP